MDLRAALIDCYLETVLGIRNELCNEYEVVKKQLKSNSLSFLSLCCHGKLVPGRVPSLSSNRLTEPITCCDLIG